MRKTLLALAVAGFSAGALASEPTLQDLLRKIEALEQQNSEMRTRIEQLEPQRQVRTESVREQRVAPAAEAAVGPQSDPLDPLPARTRALRLGGDQPVTSGTAFNPAISVILDATYAHFSDDIDEPAGFEMGHGHSHGHGHGHGIEEGFNLREAEITMTGSVDAYFDMLVTLAVSESDIEIEEAYITTRSLPAGLQIKAGKFLSDVGYINKQHPHDWHFIDQPWVREFMFGEEGLSELGVQLSWVAPTATYTRFGIELLEGESEGVANYVGDGQHQIVTVTPGPGNEPVRNRWRADKNFTEKDGPRLFTGFVKWAPDLGHDHAIQLGAFGGYARVWQSEEAHSSGRLETWDGDSRFIGADVVYKYSGSGPAGQGNLILQGEYVYRILDVDYLNRQFISFSDLSVIDDVGQKWKQDAFYVQGVYGFAPRWNAGLRVDGIGMKNRAFDGADRDDADTSWRYAGQVNFAPTEFSRLRAQVSYNHLNGADNAWQFMLQYNLSLGVHGAHAF